ncbi:malto-oligosyltrehalose synthase [Williamsia sp.]|uniref:malto-oligosyltrehalose synthase n=1 Tax=Williamsia sp. TaxID=1872085 RepID=UPI002F932FAF
MILPLSATYRLQLNSGFTFADAVDNLDHYAALGISHLYLSPIQTAQEGSEHGYDWVPPPAVSPILGGIDGLRTLRAAAADRGIGLIIDIVPNHTGVEDPRQNPWWWDVLRLGAASDHASYFDIDWSPENGADGKIALPVLGSPDDLDALEIDTSGAQPELAFYDHRFPLAPGTHTPGDTAAAVHKRQSYRLAPWNIGVIGYRRFFSVNGLAGLRQEDPAVYAATHTLVRQLVDEDLIDGIRVDHPDGLADPQGYLRNLREDIGPDRILLVEKILARGEPLDPSLPVDGTTGYEMARVIGALLVDPNGEEPLGDLHQRYAGDRGDHRWLEATERHLKLSILSDTFPAERSRLRRTLLASATDGAAPSAADLDSAIGAVIASLGVYRSDYPVLAGTLESVLAAEKQRLPALSPAFDLIAEAVAGDAEARARLAQVCGAVTAKSVEDCLFYRTARLVSLQEVGGDPGTFTDSLDDFHRINIERAGAWPRAMTTLSTHDTKRSEDVRARIGVLSQVPERWARLVDRSQARNPAPGGVTGLFLRQNLFGVWPADGVITGDLRGRFHDYATKAIREGAVGTTWTDVDTAFEAAVHTWIDNVFDGPCSEDLTDLLREVRSHVESDALLQKALGMLVPGFPDVYQGTEWFDDSLVDPDNRRQIDYTRSVDHRKVAIVRTAAALRRRRPEVFVTGDYHPLSADGPAADHVIAFGRGQPGAGISVIVTGCRLTARLDQDRWEQTTLELPPGTWRDLLTGSDMTGTVAAARFGESVAILERIRD